MLLRQSTAATLTIGPILDANGAEYTGAVIGDISVSKNGTLAALASAATLTHSANGIYTLALTTGNTDTLGRLQLVCNKSTYQMPLVGVNVVPATVYDALVTNAVNTNGGLAVGTGNITALAGAISTLTPAGTAAAVWDALLASYTTADTFGARIVRSSNSNNTVSMTGGQTPHIAAVVHDAEPNSIPEDAFVAGAISARVIATDAIDDDALSENAVTAIQSGLATSANQTTILARLGAFTGTGINTVLGFLRAMTNKAASTPSDIGGTYSATTDALEAIRDAQAAGTGDASQATLEAVQDTVDAIAAKVSGGLIEVTSRVAQGGSLLLYIGDDARVRSGTEIEITISDVGGTIYARLDGLGTAALAFGGSRRGLAAGAISGTISGLSQAGSGSTQTATLVVEIDDVGEGLQPLDDYTWQIVSTSASGDEWVEIEGQLELRRRVAIPV